MLCADPRPPSHSAASRYRRVGNASDSHIRAGSHTVGRGGSACANRRMGRRLKTRGMINSPSSALESPGPRWHSSNASPLCAPLTAERATPTILVVDSEPQALSRTRKVLHAAGYHVTTSDTFDEASRLLASLLPDLLIADVRIGAYGFNGLHLVWRRSFDHPTQRSVVTSHTSDPMLQRQARELGAPFLVKPISRDELVKVVSAVLSG